VSDRVFVALITRVELNNVPFKLSEQKNTLDEYSRMFSRLLCSVLRTVRQNHKWCQDYSFDEKQLKAVEDVWTALDEEKSDGDLRET